MSVKPPLSIHLLRTVGAAAAVVVLGLLVAPPALAQRADVEIKVVNPKKKAVGNARVTVSQEASGFSFEGTTNNKGVFKVMIPKPEGTYNFTFEADGLAAATFEFPIDVGEVKTTVTLVDQATQNEKDAVDSFNAAVVAIQGGKEDEALAAFRKAIELLPTDPRMTDAYRLIAIIEAGRGNIDAAEPALEKYLEMNPEGLQAAAPAAYDVFRARGDSRLGEVRGMLQQLGVAGDFAIKVYNEGVQANKAQDKDKAMGLFQEAATLNPGLTNAYQSMAALEFNDKNYEAALPHLAKLTELDPQNVEGQRLTFFSSLYSGNIDGARAAAKAWGTVAPVAADQIHEQARIKFEEDSTAEAEAMLEMIFDIDADHVEATRTMGMLHARKGAFRRSQEVPAAVPRARARPPGGRVCEADDRRSLGPCTVEPSNGAPRRGALFRGRGSRGGGRSTLGRAEPSSVEAEHGPTEVERRLRPAVAPTESACRLRESPQQPHPVGDAQSRPTQIVAP